MKSISVLFFSFVLLTSSVYAQDFPIDEKTGKITYTDVVDVDELSASDIYKKALAWGASKKFQLKAKEANSKIQWDGKIGVHYRGVQLGGYEDGTVTFSVVIYCKDGRYKYKLTNFKHTASHANCGPLESEKSACTRHQLPYSSWVTIKKDTHEKVQKYIQSLKATVKKTSAIIEDTDSDW